MTEAYPDKMISTLEHVYEELRELKSSLLAKAKKSQDGSLSFRAGQLSTLLSSIESLREDMKICHEDYIDPRHTLYIPNQEK